MSYKINQTDDGVISYPLHKHKNYEIMLYLEGKGCMRTEKGDFDFTEGTIIIVPPDIIHGSVSHSGFKNISVEGQFDGYFLFDTVKSLSDTALCEGTMLAKTIYENRFDDGVYLDSLCKAYACFLMRQIKSEFDVNRSIQSVISDITKNSLDSEINLTSILLESGYSEDYARARFKACTGKTPNEFLTDIRMKHACFLIDIYKNELSLSEIAGKCGYTDYVYFSKRFKSTVGVSPRKYKEQ